MRFLSRRPALLASALLAISLSLSGCAGARAPAADPAPLSAVAKKPAPESKDVDPALWKVSDADTTIYIFGTIHVLKPGLGWFDEAVREAFDASDTLVLEMVEPAPADMMALITSMAIDREGVSVRSRLNDPERAAYEAQMATLGLPQDAFDPMKPWMASVSLSMTALGKAGFDPSTGVETALSAAARSQGKAIVGLETVEQQLGYFDTLPMDVQVRYLNQTVTRLPETQSGMTDMIDIWAGARTDDLARLLNEGMSDPMIYRRLITDRNVRWADWIARRMEQPGTLFVAVGAGHLAGSESLFTHLRAHKLQAQRIDY